MANSTWPWCFSCLACIAILLALAPLAQSRYSKDWDITWAPQNVKSVNNDHVWQLALTSSNASGMASKKRFLFGSISMNLKLVRGNSSGTVTTYYFSSESTNRDELDFEFLGNVSKQPYVLQTNVYCNGTGGREQRINLWFDPSAAYHNYSIIWNPQQIVFYVDGTPIRVFANNEAAGLPYLNSQPLRTIASIWNGDSWATEGGRVKIDWKDAPFIASYGKYLFDACLEGSSSNCTSGKWWNGAPYQTMSTDQVTKLNTVKQNYTIYNYCTDSQRYPVPPKECSLQPY